MASIDRELLIRDVNALFTDDRGANDRDTLHEDGRAPYLCGLEFVVRASPDGLAPGYAAVRLLKNAIAAIGGGTKSAGVGVSVELPGPTGNLESARAISALLGLGEDQGHNPAQHRAKAARRILLVSEDRFKKSYRSRLAGLLVDAITEVAVFSDPLLLPFEPLERLEAIRRKSVEAERERLLKFEHGLPKLALRAARLLPPTPVDQAPDLMATVLDEWIRDPYSNLALLLAGFGTGKTTAALDFVENGLPSGSERIAIFVRYVELLPALTEGTSLVDAIGHLLFPDLEIPTARQLLISNVDRLFITIDGFDASVLPNGGYRTAPDLCDLTELLRPSSKILVVTDRIFNSDDELIVQIRDADRSSDLGLVKPILVQLLAPAHKDIVDALTAVLDADTSPRMLRYLDRLLKSKVDALRRPLFLQMLVGVAARSMEAHDSVDSGNDGALTLMELFDRYVEVALRRDYDRATSYIKPAVKRSAIRSIAFDLFEEAIGQFQESVDELRVQTHLMSVLPRADIKIPPGHTFDSYSWIDDFWLSNRLVVRQDNGKRPVGSRSVRFDNDTFLDYFLAEAILDRTDRGQVLGIDETTFHESALSSLVLYFMKQGSTEDHIIRQAEKVARRQQCSNLDRMLMIFLLEDDPCVVNVIRSAPEAYRAFLYAVEQRYVTVLARVVKYQLVLLEDDRHEYTRALDFIDWAIRGSREKHVEPEGEQPAFREPLEPFLLNRLHNRVLEAAVPITVFRLGQFGGHDSIKPIERVAERFSEHAVGDVCADALRAIRERITKEER